MADRPRVVYRRKAPPPVAGWGGVKIAAGRIVDVEQNAELRGELWPQTAEQMIRTDDAVQAGVEAIVGTLLSARWTVTPGDRESPFSRQLADELTTMLGIGVDTPGMMSRGWEAVVEQFAMAELIGFSVGEPRWGYAAGFGVVLEDIEDRAQSSIRRWHTAGGRLVSIEQAPVMEGDRFGGAPVIPAGQLVLLTRGGSGLNFAGRGLLRGCFALWRLKRHLIDMVAIGAERAAVGVPWLQTDWPAAEAAGVSRADYDADLEVAREALDSLVAQDRHWIESGPGVQFAQIGGDFDVGKSLLPGLEYCDRGILRAMLVQFLALGMSDASGSRALGEVVETFFRRNAAQGLDRVAGVMNGAKAAPDAPNGVIGSWVEYNHGPVDPRLLPRLGHSGLTVAPIVQLAQANGIDLSAWLPATPERRSILARELQLPPEPPPAPAPPAGGQTE